MPAGSPHRSVPADAGWVSAPAPCAADTSVGPAGLEPVSLGRHARCWRATCRDSWPARAGRQSHPGRAAPLRPPRHRRRRRRLARGPCLLRRGDRRLRLEGRDRRVRGRGDRLRAGGAEPWPGLGTELVATMVDWASQQPGVRRVVAEVRADNLPSRPPLHPAPPPSTKKPRTSTTKAKGPAPPRPPQPTTKKESFLRTKKFFLEAKRENPKP